MNQTGRCSKCGEVGKVYHRLPKQPKLHKDGYRLALVLHNGVEFCLACYAKTYGHEYRERNS